MLTTRRKFIKNSGAVMGYSEVEMCSPLGYTGTGFEKLNDMSGTEMKEIMTDAGLFARGGKAGPERQ